MSEQRASVYGRERRSRSYPPRLDDPLTVTVRDYLQVQIDAMEQRSMMRYTELHEMMDRRFLAMQAATDKADAALNLRLQSMNEIRDQLGAQRATFATNDRLDALSAAVRVQQDTLLTQLNTSVGVLRESAQRDNDALRDRTDRDQKLTNDAISALQQQWAGVYGRITGIGVIVILLSLALQVIFFVITSGH